MSRRLCAAALLALGLVGCGGPKIVPVSGVVTMNGSPLAGAHVHFQYESPDTKNAVSGSYGKTDAKGRYTLRLINPDRPGAAVGKHRVAISLLGEASEESDASFKLTPDRIPWIYRGNQSILTFEVPDGGTEQANFALEYRPRKRR